MQSKSWLESRLNYRRLVLKMIKEIETHCEDVICLTQNQLCLTPEAFLKICDATQIESLGPKDSELIDSKQSNLCA
jgi:hypothetical protein